MCVDLVGRGVVMGGRQPGKGGMVSFEVDEVEHPDNGHLDRTTALTFDRWQTVDYTESTCRNLHADVESVR